MDLENDRNVINNNVMSLGKNCDETTKEYLDSSNKEATADSKEDIPEARTVNNEITSVFNVEVENEDVNVGNNVENTIENSSVLDNVPENTPMNDSAPEDLSKDTTAESMEKISEVFVSRTVDNEITSAFNTKIENENETVGNNVKNIIEDSTVLDNIPEKTPMNNSAPEDSLKETTAKSKKNIPDGRTVNNKITSAFNMEVENKDESIGDNVKNIIENSSILENVPENTPMNNSAPEDSLKGTTAESMEKISEVSVSRTVDNKITSAFNMEVENMDESIGDNVKNIIENSSTLENVPENTPMNDSAPEDLSKDTTAESMEKISEVSVSRTVDNEITSAFNMEVENKDESIRDNVKNIIENSSTLENIPENTPMNNSAPEDSLKGTTAESMEKISEVSVFRTVDNEITSAFNMEVENKDESIRDNVKNIIENSSTLENVPENTPMNNSAPEDSPALNEGVKSNKRRILIQDSDSEDENVISKTDDMEVENDNTNNTHSTSNRIDSDSEDENLPNNDTTSARKALRLIDSDSEESETPQVSSTDSKGKLQENNTERWRMLCDPESSDEDCRNDTEFKSDNEKDITKPKRKNIDSDSEESEAPHVSNTNSKGDPPENIERWRLLCDPESSDEECRNETEPKSDNEEDVTKPIVYKRKKSKHNKEEPAAVKMTPKEASKVRQDIKRESQRMVRESNVSLPYHKPKSFSIKDFLSRRSQMASTVVPIINTKTPPSVAIKMSMDQLEAITKKLKEREKEVKEFYKSESEDEEDDEGDKNYVPPVGVEESNDENKGGEGDVKGTEGTITDNGEENDIDKEVVNEPEQIEQNQQETVLALDHIDETAQSNSNLENIKDISVQNTTEVEPSNEAVVSNEENCTSEETTRLLEKYQESMDYEFSVSDSEDQAESLQQPGTSMQYGELDKEIERFQTSEEKRYKIELLKKKFGDSTPRLSGNPNEIINLETGVSRPSELTEFVERFMKHSEKKKVHKDKVKLSIISIESGEIQEETIAMDVEEDNLTIEDKPGMRMKKLRNELESQMAQMKSELWQKKSMIKEETEKTKEGYEEGEDIEDDILDDEEEEELSEEDDEFEEEDEVMYEEKKRKKSEFVDDEADEDDEEECEEMANDVNDDEEQNEACEDDVEDDASNDEAVNDADNETNCNIDEKTPKKLRRILKAFTDDSDEEENADVTLKDSKIDSSGDDNLHISITEDSTQDEVIPLNQQTGQTVKTPLRTPNKSSSEFLTPISYITGLQNLNKSASKNLKDSPVSPFRIPNVPSPLRDCNWQSSLQKKLFNDGEITNSQIDDIAEMCSENFTESQAVEENQITQDDIQDQQSQITCTQDLLNVCSGNFGCLESSDPTAQDAPSNSTQDAPSNSTQTVIVERSEKKELKGLDFEENNLISQLLDEEEMENFKKKIESPSKVFEESDGRGGVIDSDDDGDGENLEVKLKRTKTKLQFSDEESSDDEKESAGNDEKIDLYDEDDENEETTDLSPENVDYDSEENEVIIDSNLAAKPKLKASDFFEDEAELSESDWDSADEDEKGMDAMEEEQGDAEKYDEDEVRRDLEKIHMRRLLDDDTKEVKLLQELYLEDGELHGTGRERKFRWRNIDSINDEEGQDKKNEDETYLDGEDESEEQWRKKRHEREMFLLEQKKKRQEVDEGGESDEDESLSNSQLLKLGRKVISKSLNGTSVEKVKSIEEKVDYKSVFTVVNRRGSFLSRGEQVLQRVATYNKESTSASVTKTSKNFLFQTISSKETTITTLDRKRGAEDGTPRKIKKLRLSENFSPANRIPGKGSAKGKSLFGNLD